MSFIKYAIPTNNLLLIVFIDIIMIK